MIALSKGIINSPKIIVDNSTYMEKLIPNNLNSNFLKMVIIIFSKLTVYQNF